MAAARQLSEQRVGARPPRRRAAPSLRVVKGRPRWPAVIGAGLLLTVMTSMLGAAVFHTQLAQRQLEIDELEREVRAERERFDELRNTRAVLRSPQRIGGEAERLGMVRGESSHFIDIDPLALAMQIATAGATDDDVVRVIVDIDPLDQFRDVKAVSAGQP